MSESLCWFFVTWWDGEYEGNCILDKNHDGDHFDGISWFDDERNCRDGEHYIEY